MENHVHPGNEFLRKVTSVIQTHLEDEKFGVSELAGKVGMSRSNLLRKVNKLTGMSVSRYIRQLRLEKAKELLREGTYNVSEVAFMVGFSSTSYFIKCFRETYGTPPGETARMAMEVEEEVIDEPTRKIKRSPLSVVVVSLMVVGVVILMAVWKPFSKKPGMLEKSIAVLPFRNDSGDSTNIYLINGIMESLLDDLQQIEDLRVISRTSVEKYRSHPKSISEIADELKVNYVVEGSGQKVGNRILLHVQLIEAASDQRIWSEQYRREVKDIFSLQTEVARGITEEIKAMITPEEEQRISSPPTQNLLAYDYFLQGLDRFYEGTREGLLASIDLFQKAIKEDHEFARAYADISIAYSYLDWSQNDKLHTAEADAYADQALLYDPKLSQSLIAKALFHMNNDESLLAIPFLEKALEYNPNSATVINLLSEFYTNYLPDTEKYLEYALRGIRLDIASHDSSDASYIYMHLSNALLQSGFIDEAEHYIQQSITYNPDNLFSRYIRAYILLARDMNLTRTRDLLIEILQNDTTRVDILQEVAKICYYMRDYRAAFHYYRQYLKIKQSSNLDIYRGEDAKIGLVFSEMGRDEEADSLFRAYLEYAENDLSMYKHLSLAVYAAYQGERVKSLEHLEQFARQESFSYLLVPFLKIDPLVDRVKEMPEFMEITAGMEKKVRERHQRIRVSLEEKGLL
jgi:TolB-like protein/AraC-like DNA-binding protein/Tfp pilus assembly protein PilF